MKILFVSLGCDKNLVDSEKMLGMLQEKGYTFTDDEAEADVVVVNTCCFIGDAKEESINTLLQMGELKDSGQVKALIAAGCLAQRYREEIQKEIPQVDAIIGTTAIDEIVAALEEILAGQKQNHYEDINAAPVTETNRVVTTGGHFAYLKIAEGCDKHCTYCIIPKVLSPNHPAWPPSNRIINGTIRITRKIVSLLGRFILLMVYLSYQIIFIGIGDQNLDKISGHQIR